MILSEEHKAKMREGRQRAAAERKASGITKSPKRRTVLRDPVVMPEFLTRRSGTKESEVPREFLGINKTDCPIDCNFQRCVITGAPVCGHPCKGGIQPAQMQDRNIVERYNRARKHLAHVELDKRP